MRTRWEAEHADRLGVCKAPIVERTLDNTSREVVITGGAGHLQGGWEADGCLRGEMQGEGRVAI